MPRRHKGGWSWEPIAHIDALAACLRDSLRAEQTALRLMEEFQGDFPDMLLTKNSIISALRNKSVPARLRARYPEADSWIAEFKRHKPGRGKKGGSGGARIHPKKGVRPGRPATAEDVIRLRQSKGPAQ